MAVVWRLGGNPSLPSHPPIAQEEGGKEMKIKRKRSWRIGDEYEFCRIGKAPENFVYVGVYHNGNHIVSIDGIRRLRAFANDILKSLRKAKRTG